MKRFVPLLLSVFALPAYAASPAYPTKPIRLIVPFPAGGGVDAVARVCAQKLSEQLGQQVVIDNRGGSGGIIAAELAAAAAPDGHTLFFGGSASHGVTPHLYRKLPYDAVKDFTPVALIGNTPYFFVVHPSVQAQNVKELIALAKAKPGTLNYASAGNGSTIHLTGEMFKSMAGVSITHIPYKGAAPAMNDLLSGQVQMTFLPAGVILQHVKLGRLRALAVTGAQRTKTMPELPTIAESAVPGFSAVGWYGLLGPAALPPGIVSRLETAVKGMLIDHELVERFLVLGIDVTPAGPAEFGRYIKGELEKWGKVVRDSHAKAD
jgi:tripartite-type tricarboxylate transporter receptor subunit TctC